MEKMLSPHASLISQPIRPLKRVEYDKLVADGCFQDERVELVFGMVVEMSPIDQAHHESVRRIYKALLERIGGRGTVWSQSSFAATDDSEPEPDVCVTPSGDHWHTRPDHAFLVVEVARSSLRYDRGPKALLYGISHVDEYWIVNHVDGCIEVYRDRRSDGTWATCTTFTRGQRVAMQAFADVEIDVADVLPPA